MTHKLKRNQGKLRGKPQAAPGGTMPDAHDMAFIKAHSRADYRVNVGYSNDLYEIVPALIAACERTRTQ